MPRRELFALMTQYSVTEPIIDLGMFLNPVSERSYDNCEEPLYVSHGIKLDPNYSRLIFLARIAGSYFSVPKRLEKRRNSFIYLYEILHTLIVNCYLFMIETNFIFPPLINPPLSVKSGYTTLRWKLPLVLCLLIACCGFAKLSFYIAFQSIKSLLE